MRRLSMGLSGDEPILVLAHPLDPGPIELNSEFIRALEASAMSRVDTDPVFGVSTVMQPIREQVDRIARSPRAVLITGENGNSKSRLARFIHKKSGRADFQMESIRLRRFAQGFA